MTLSSEFVTRHISTWSDSLNRGFHSYRSRWPHYLFHHAPLENALGILEDGYLRSRNDPSNHRHRDVAAQQVLANRDDAHDKVRLYFRPRTPTQFHIEGIRKEGECAYGSDAHCPVLVMFIFKAESIFSLPNVSFSDRNMQLDTALQGDDEPFFSSIPFDKVYHVGGIAGDRSIIEHRCAEVLLGEPLNVTNHLKAILFRSEPERDTFLHFWRERGLGPAPKSRVSDALKAFEKKFAFVQSLELSPEGVLFTLNPRGDRQNSNIEINVSDEQGNEICHFKYENLAAQPPSAARWIARHNFENGRYLVQITIEGHLAFQAWRNSGDALL